MARQGRGIFLTHYLCDFPPWKLHYTNNCCGSTTLHKSHVFKTRGWGAKIFPQCHEGRDFFPVYFRGEWGWFFFVYRFPLSPPPPKKNNNNERALKKWKNQASHACNHIIKVQTRLRKQIPLLLYTHIMPRPYSFQFPFYSSREIRQNGCIKGHSHRFLSLFTMGLQVECKPWIQDFIKLFFFSVESWLLFNDAWSSWGHLTSQMTSLRIHS